MYVGTNWANCVRCNILTAHQGTHPLQKGLNLVPLCSTCGGSDGAPKDTLKQENEALKARILRLEERIAELTPGAT